MNDFVDELILKQVQVHFQSPEICNTLLLITVNVANGKTLTILIPVKNQSHSSTKSDGIKQYANCVLEIGLIYKSLLQHVKIPNRDRMISLMKYLMCVLKGHSVRSKYALEILRFLCQQMPLLSEQTALQSFYGLFVNTKGKFDSFIAADLEMEHMVRLVKSHSKSVQSNKSEATFSKRTSAFAGMEKIVSLRQ